MSKHHKKDVQRMNPRALKLEKLEKLEKKEWEIFDDQEDSPTDVMDNSFLTRPLEKDSEGPLPKDSFISFGQAPGKETSLTPHTSVPFAKGSEEESKASTNSRQKKSTSDENLTRVHPRQEGNGTRSDQREDEKDYKTPPQELQENFMELVSEVERQHNSLQQLQGKLKMTEDEKKELQAKLSEVIESDELLSKDRELQKKNDLEKKKSRIHDLDQEEIELLKDEVKLLVSEMESQRSLIDKLRNKLKETEDIKDTTESKNRKLQEDLRQLSEERAELMGQFKTPTAEDNEEELEISVAPTQDVFGPEEGDEIFQAVQSLQQQKGRTPETRDREGDEKTPSGQDQPSISLGPDASLVKSFETFASTISDQVGRLQKDMVQLREKVESTPLAGGGNLTPEMEEEMRSLKDLVKEIQKRPASSDEEGEIRNSFRKFTLNIIEQMQELKGAVTKLQQREASDQAPLVDSFKAFATTVADQIYELQSSFRSLEKRITYQERVVDPFGSPRAHESMVTPVTGAPTYYQDKITQLENTLQQTTSTLHRLAGEFRNLQQGGSPSSSRETRQAPSPSGPNDDQIRTLLMEILNEVQIARGNQPLTEKKKTQTEVESSPPLSQLLLDKLKHKIGEEEEETNLEESPSSVDIEASPLTTSELYRQFLAFFLYQGVPCVEPYPQPDSVIGYVYQDLQKWGKVSAGEEVSFLEQGMNEGYFTKELVDRIHLCPQCYRYKINFRETCPSCSGLEFEILGPDAAQMGGRYLCHTCQSQFSGAEVEGRCLHCSHDFPVSEAILYSVYRYIPTVKGLGLVIASPVIFTKPPIDSPLLTWEEFQDETKRELNFARRMEIDLSMIHFHPIKPSPSGNGQSRKITALVALYLVQTLLHREVPMAIREDGTLVTLLREVSEEDAQVMMEKLIKLGRSLQPQSLEFKGRVSTCDITGGEKDSNLLSKLEDKV